MADVTQRMLQHLKSKGAVPATKQYGRLSKLDLKYAAKQYITLWCKAIAENKLKSSTPYSVVLQATPQSVRTSLMPRTQITAVARKHMLERTRARPMSPQWRLNRNPRSPLELN